ncbi:DUF998 domain-containing protein [Leifsonia sp. YIM 134122]|uniref:DUF998 domain-containing protein n=1 Tax=Leifsonia stereocauli TaxID=3134136 RepID=A0ABU9W421_9MICO
MTTTTTTAVATSGTDAATRAQLTAGVIAGPLFITTALLQAGLRPGFDLTRHPISLLSLGDLGWIQIVNFIVAGTLLIVFSLGLARRLRPGAARLWAPILFAIGGFGMILGGVFPPDAALGFPVGAPEGIPPSLSFHGLMHAVAPPVAFTAIVAGIAVAARRIWLDGHRGAAVLSWIAAGVCFVLSLPGWPLFSILLLVAVGIGLGWVCGYAIWLLRTDAALRPRTASGTQRTEVRGTAR